MTRRSNFSIAGWLIGGFAALLALTPPAAQAASQTTPAISEEASTALVDMGKALLAKEFSFEARTIRAYTGPDGEALHALSQDRCHRAPAGSPAMAEAVNRRRRHHQKRCSTTAKASR